MYTKSQNYKNMVVGKHGIQTFEVMLVVVVCFCPRKCISLIIIGQVIYPNTLKCQLSEYNFTIAFINVLTTRAHQRP